MLSEEVKKEREQFIEELLSGNYTTYFVATHPKYSKSKGQYAAFRFTPTPQSMAVPYMWKYKDARNKLMRLAELLTPEEAERRNINFVNPNLKEVPGATLPTLRGGIQLLNPGERAYTHRHTANAFRFVLEAPTEGAFTVVQGRKVPMRPGDLILTPNWTWHDHHNEGKSPAIWFDGLDAIMAFWMGGVFFEEFAETSEGYQTADKTVEEISSRYGAGLVPVEGSHISGVPESDNPLLYYSYNDARKSLVKLSELSQGDPHNGTVLRYVNPLSGQPTFPSMEACLRLVKGNSETKLARRTENIIFITMEGNPSFELENGQRFQTEPFDVVALPSWTKYHIKNSDAKPAIVFSYSDKPVFDYLGFYREQKS
ncbi:MAG: cupin domain-containing protein [Nitrososphaerales archaeon]